MQNIRIAVKLSPKAAQNAIQGWAEGPDGQRWLKCSVTAVPEKGKANKALIGLLAEHLGMPKSAFTLLRGETDRIKVIEIQGVNKDAESLLTPSSY